MVVAVSLGVVVSQRTGDFTMSDRQTPMSEPHHSARLKRDHLRKKSTDAADRFEREYVRAIGKDASPMYAFHIASLTLLEDMAKRKIDSGDVDVPDGAEESIDGYRHHRRVLRENAGLPTNWDAADVTDADELPSIEELSDATDSAGR
jgi:hypothetical protein